MCELAQNLGKLKSVKIMQTLKVTIFDFSREIEVGQNKVNKSGNFSREIEVCQTKGTFFVKIYNVHRT